MKGTRTWRETNRSPSATISAIWRFAQCWRRSSTTAEQLVRTS